DSVCDSRRPQHFDGLAHDTRTSHLPGVRHEAEARGTRTLNQAGQGRCGDRLVAHQAEADHSLSREGDVKRSCIAGRGPATDKLHQPGDLDPEVAGDISAAADDAIDPAIYRMEVRV